MLKTKRKLRNRKTKVKRYAVFFLIVGLISVGTGYMLSAKPFESQSASVPKKKFSVNEQRQHEKIFGIIKNALAKEQIEVLSIEAVRESYVITLKDDKTVIFSSIKDVQSQISSLQFILSRLTMEGKQFSRLDLRFDKPIIVAK